jgi:hypothetical protein
VLTGTQVTDDGLELGAEFPELRKRLLDSTRISDEGIRRLGGLKKPTYLELRNTLVSDAAAPDLMKFTTLKTLNLSPSRMSGGKVAEVLKALRIYPYQ